MAQWIKAVTTNPDCMGSILWDLYMVNGVLETLCQFPMTALTIMCMMAIAQITYLTVILFTSPTGVSLG